MNEKIWTGKVAMMYPKKYIVMANLEYDKSGTNKIIGEIVAVKDTFDEAFTIMKDLDMNSSMGETMLFQGDDDTPQIGGLCVR